MRKQDRIILWPIYFDSTKTRSEGRRISKKLATPAPKLEEIKKATELIGLVPEVVYDAAYPSISRLKIGLVKVPKKGSKTQITQKIAKKILENRVKPNDS